MTRQSESLSPELYQYLVEHSAPRDAVLEELAAETLKRYPDDAGMQIGPEQGTFTTLITRLTGATSAVELGTFTGYSAICLARGLADGGRLLCCDVSEEWTAVARHYWEKAGVADRIDLKIGPALETLRALPAETTFDVAFIDADKTGYPAYWDELVPRIRPGGILLIDNTLAHGGVIDPAARHPAVQAIRDFNTQAVRDDRVEVVILPIGDGLTLAYKK